MYTELKCSPETDPAVIFSVKSLPDVEAKPKLWNDLEIMRR